MFPSAHGVVSQERQGGAPPSASKFYRLLIAANNGSSATFIAELELRTEPDGPSIATGGTPSASSEAAALYSADKAFDGNASTFWSSGNAAFPVWLQYELLDAAKVVQYALRARSASTSGTPKDWALQGSDDGVTWTDLHTVTDEADWSNGERRIFSL